MQHQCLSSLGLAQYRGSSQLMTSGGVQHAVPASLGSLCHEQHMKSALEPARSAWTLPAVVRVAQVQYCCFCVPLNPKASNSAFKVKNHMTVFTLRHAQHHPAHTSVPTQLGQVSCCCCRSSLPNSLQTSRRAKGTRAERARTSHQAHHCFGYFSRRPQIDL